MADRKRQPKGMSTGGQFAPDVNTESTVLLADETKPTIRVINPNERTDCYFVAQERWETLSTEEAEDAEIVRRTDESVWLRLGDGRMVIVRDGLLAFDEDAVEEALSKPSSRTYVNPNSDLTMAEREQVVRDIERDVADLKTKIESHNASDDWEDGSEYEEVLLHVQEELVSHQKAIIEQYRAQESSFDLEAAVAERVIATIEADAQADMTHEEANRVEELVHTYFKGDPSDIFENGLGQLLDKEADIFMQQRKDELAEIVGEDD